MAGGTLLASRASGGRLYRYTIRKYLRFCWSPEPAWSNSRVGGYYVWVLVRSWRPDGKIHVFFSRWDAKKGMGGWINGSEIAHAIADKPEGPYVGVETILAPRGEGSGWNDLSQSACTTIDGTYCLFYMGNSNGRLIPNASVGLADSLYGPWRRPEKPLLEAGADRRVG
jgi:hypothetical protein